MGPNALRVFANGSPTLKKLLAKAQHFLIDEPLFDTAESIQRDTFEAHGQLHFSGDLPAPVVVVEIEQAGLTVFERVPEGIGVIIPGAMPHMTDVSHVAVYNRGVKPSDDCFRANDELDTKRLSDLHLLGHVNAIDILFSLIAEPRLTRLTQPVRADRRRAQRALGDTPLPVWHKVGWNLGETTTPKRQPADDGHRMPLHFCRAHWVRSEQGKPKAEQRAGHPGWWTWRRHSWKGHPAFGIKLHHYSPSLNDKSADLIDRTKLAASRAASAAAIEGWGGPE